MRRRQGLALGIVGLVLLLGGERSWADPPTNPTRSDSLGNTRGGTGVLSSNTTGPDNTGFGDGALSSNTTGSGNAAYGFQALFSNTTGSYNTASGLFALIDNTTGW